MTKFVEVNVPDLVGPALDWSVAHATKAWEWAQEWFPTMTLDPTFRGVSDNAPGGHVRLIATNPMRQDSQDFMPSTDWAQGGRLMDKYCSSFGLVQDSSRNNWRAFAYKTDAQEVEFKRLAGGPTILVAACRAIVLVSLGDTVKVPAELMP